MDFLPIASGSAGNAYLLSCAGSPDILVEAGISWPEIQKASGFTASKLCAVLCSHEHGDHSRSVLNAAKAGVDVYVSPGTFGELGVPDELRPRFRNVVGAPLMVGPWKVGAFAVQHDAAEPVGFLVGSPDGDKLVYLSDAYGCDIHFSDLTHIAVECNHDEKLLAASGLDGHVKDRIRDNHVSLGRCLEFLALQDMAKVKGIWLLHLSDANSDAARFRAAVQTATGRPTYVAVANVATANAEDAEWVEGVLRTARPRMSASGATVLELRLDGDPTPIFVANAKFHGYILAGVGQHVAISATKTVARNGAECWSLVDISMIGTQWFKGGEPCELAPQDSAKHAPVSGMPLSFKDTDIPF